jgi:hypothetical protein
VSCGVDSGRRGTEPPAPDSLRSRQQARRAVVAMTRAASEPRAPRNQAAPDGVEPESVRIRTQVVATRPGLSSSRIARHRPVRFPGGEVP